MKKFLVPISLGAFLLICTAVWYFGHHRPAQQLLTAEPKRVYIPVPLAPNTVTAERHAHEVPHRHTDKPFRSETPEKGAATTESSTTSSLSDTTDTLYTAAEQTGMLDEGTVMQAEQFDTPHSHSHDVDPEAEARLEAAKVEFARASLYREEVKAKTEPKIIAHVNSLNAMSPEDQREHWEKFRNALLTLSIDDQDFDLDAYIQSFIEALIEYGYQPQY